MIVNGVAMTHPPLADVHFIDDSQLDWLPNARLQMDHKTGQHAGVTRRGFLTGLALSAGATIVPHDLSPYLFTIPSPEHSLFCGAGNDKAVT